MASSSAVARSARLIARSEPCAFCFARQFGGPISSAKRNQNGAPRRAFGFKRGPAKVKLNRTGEMKLYEEEVRARRGVFQFLRRDNQLAMPPQEAESFLAHFKQLPPTDIAAGLDMLAQKFKVKLSDLTDLGHALIKVPAITDSSGHVWSDKDKVTAKELWLALSRAGEPSAILHILKADYLKDTVPGAAQAINLFSKGELIEVRKKMDHLVQNKELKNAEILSLAGQFAEREGQRKRALELYQAALEVADLKTVCTGKSIALPQMPPYNAIGFICLSNPSKESQDMAKEAFEIGALQADDPVSFYHLAKFEDMFSFKWLRYMSKAASSGHPDAMYQLAKFYNNADTKRNEEFKMSMEKDSMLAKALKWILSWKPERTLDLADEWLTSAANSGHKGAMWMSAETLEAKGELLKAKQWLERVVHPAGGAEEWPELVEKARKKLNTPDYFAVTAPEKTA